MSKPILSQSEIMSIVLPKMQTMGQIFVKIKRVYARQARGGEKIITTTKDGKETQNVARKGDFIVHNQTGAAECYVMSPEKFEARYAFNTISSDGQREYLPIGKIKALELKSELLEALKLPKQFKFMAHWGEPMIAKAGDFLACPLDESEIYRIANKEFFETYALDKQT